MGASELGILPRPQIVRMGGGRLFWRRVTSCRLVGVGTATMPWVKRDFSGVRFVPGGRKGYSAVFSLPGATSAVPAGDTPRRAEAYVLCVSPQGAAVSAFDAAGLWYGLQTLRQLIDVSSDGMIPTVTIQDWPVLAVRGIHIDLKGYQPRFSDLLDYCRTLARYKINNILLEVEDKFAFSSAPGVAVPEAYTAAQMQELARQCAAMFIEVVPKLQCLAHVDYILGKAAYRGLAEDNHPFQYCPRNARGFRLWAAMCDELIDALPGGKYFHVGADESGYLGQCPTCRKFRKADSYVHRVGASVRHVLRAGRRPIMWEDILRNLHHNLSDREVRDTWMLGRQAILMYWAYGYGGQGNEFPFLADYLAKGMEVWGASGFSGCGPSWIQNVPPFAERALNIQAWTAAAVSAGLPGVLCTGWGRIGSADPPAEPQETGWLPVLWNASSCWTGAPLDVAFCRNAAKAFFGIDDATFAKAWEAADRTALPADWAAKARRNRKRLALLATASDVTAHIRQRESLFEILQMFRTPLMERRLADYRVLMVRQRLDGFAKARQARIKVAKRILAKFYEPSTVEAFMDSRFGADVEITERLEQLLKGISG